MSKGNASMWFLVVLGYAIVVGGFGSIFFSMYNTSQKNHQAIDEYMVWSAGTHCVMITNKVEVHNGSQVGWDPLYITVAYDTLPSKRAQEWLGPVDTEFVDADRSEWDSVQPGQSYLIRQKWSTYQLWQSGASPNDTITLLPHRSL